ncbi:MAG: YcxB family protein [Burkholderiaceae bacterium]|nr:YcxB family protein [Burkholderiaceae bacterium]
MTLSDMLILLVCFAFMPIITAVNLYLARRRNPLCIGPFKYVFDQFGVHASSVAFENTIRWAALLKVIESGEFILYYIASSNAVAIPKPQLIAAGALDTVRDITRSNFPAFKG